jgi:hypothetical protein
MTAKLSQTDDLRKLEPAKALAASPSVPHAPDLQTTQKTIPSEMQDKRRDSVPLSAAKDELKQLDEKKSVERRELAAGSAGAAIAISPGVSGGSAHGMVAARAKASPYDGPAAANQLQQQNVAQQNVAQQNTLKESQNVAADAANKPTVAGATPSQTVTVQADTVEMSVAPASAPAPQVSSVPVTGKNNEMLPPNIAALSKVKKITLPSGLGTLSVASGTDCSIALDAAGAMFLSEDGGKHWQPIQVQWTGRAILVRTMPVTIQTAAALQTPQTIRFELVNDKHQTWTSSDGKLWTPESPVEK